MPTDNIAAQNVLKRKKKEVKRDKNALASSLAAASRSHTSPIDLSERPMQTLIFSIPPPLPPPQSQRSRLRLDQLLENDTRHLVKRELNSGFQKF